jgi:hypothetical protein
VGGDPIAWIPSDELFVNRLAWLVRRDGVQSVARFYGRDRETVRRWLRPRGQRPRQSIQRSVARRGLAITGPTQPARDEAGRFTRRIIDRRTRAAIDTINQSRQLARATAMREARTARQERLAEMLPTELTPAEEQDLDRRLQDLIRRDALGEDTADDWRAFDVDYNAWMGNR